MRDAVVAVQTGPGGVNGQRGLRRAELSSGGGSGSTATTVGVACTSASTRPARVKT